MRILAIKALQSCNFNCFWDREDLFIQVAPGWRTWISFDDSDNLSGAKVNMEKTKVVWWSDKEERTLVADGMVAPFFICLHLADPIAAQEFLDELSKTDPEKVASLVSMV
jgi:hypothetical protein